MAAAVEVQARRLGAPSLLKYPYENPYVDNWTVPAVGAAPRFLGFYQGNWKVGVVSAPYPGHSCPGDSNLDWKVGVGDGDGEGHGDGDCDWLVVD